MIHTPEAEIALFLRRVKFVAVALLIGWGSGCWRPS
jgi:hypothetical protein